MTRKDLQTAFDQSHGWIVKRRDKTGVECTTPLLDIPAKILEKYQGLGKGDRLLPVPCYARTKYLLKQIVAECAIDRHVTWHQSTFVHQHQGAIHVAFDGRLVGREGEEQFVEAADVLTRLDGTVLGHILRQGQHQALAAVQHIDTLTLRLGEAVRRPHGVTRERGARR